MNSAHPQSDWVYESTQESSGSARHLYLWEDHRRILSTNNLVSLNLLFAFQTYLSLFPSQPGPGPFPSLCPPKCSCIIDYFPIPTSFSDSVCAETGSSCNRFSPSSTATSDLEVCSSPILSPSCPCRWPPDCGLPQSMT